MKSEVTKLGSYLEAGYVVYLSSAVDSSYAIMFYKWEDILFILLKWGC